MTDKVQKIRSYLADMANADGAITVVAKAINKEILPYIDSLQEEPVSKEPMFKQGDILYNVSNYRKIKIIDIVADQYKFECGDEYPHYEFFGYIESNYSKCPISENLEEAARRYNEEMSWRWGAPNYPHMEAFKEGARWQKRQMMKDAIDATVESNPDSHGADYGLQKLHIDYGQLEAKGIKPGTKVKVIVIKEDKICKQSK